MQRLAETTAAQSQETQTGALYVAHLFAYAGDFDRASGIAIPPGFGLGRKAPALPGGRGRFTRLIDPGQDTFFCFGERFVTDSGD